MSHSDLRIPPGYRPVLGFADTQAGIRLIKDEFQARLARALGLRRVTSPLLVAAGTGLNDDLTGVEQPIRFGLKDIPGVQAEIVQSLAKWKRWKLGEYGIPYPEGIYTDMNAIRPDEALDNLHSVYVDQWDWEKVISRDERNLEFLRSTVRIIYQVIRATEQVVADHYPEIATILPRDITFVHAEELEQRYPDLAPAQRENRICEERGAVFVVGIGAPLGSGRPHDGRAPDYDDWVTPTADGFRGLNGDILVWHPPLQRAMELSSMGIRVDGESLRRQLEQTGHQNREDLPFHRKVLRDELPLSIGGGIGQSRLCMFYLRKVHIGEVQAGIWPDYMLQRCRAGGIPIL